MTFLTLGLFLIIWVPYIVITEVFPRVISATMVGYVGFQIFLYVMFSNSFINVFIYAWRNEPFRNAFKLMLGIKKNVKVTGSDSTTLTNVSYKNSMDLTHCNCIAVLGNSKNFLTKNLTKNNTDRRYDLRSLLDYIINTVLQNFSKKMKLTC